MEYEKCYVFEPEESRPAKRKRTEAQGLQVSWKLRKTAYKEAWKRPQERITEVLHAINAATVSDIAAFLDEALPTQNDGRIPTGLILAGPTSALRTSVATQVSALIAERTRRIFVPISSTTGSNLKSILKAIIQKATSRNSSDDDEEFEEASSTRKGRKLLNYDLQALHDHVRERGIRQVVVAVEDTEAFDGDLLSELVEMLGCWQDRIRFACLMNVATSVDFLQHRLSKPAVRYLDGRLFDAALSTEEIEQVFGALLEPDTIMYLGPSLLTLMLERQTDYIQSIETLVQAARYAYMSLFYANALSIFLMPDLGPNQVTSNHYEALRNLPSFRSHARRQLDEGHTEVVRGLLDSDRRLFDFAQQSVAKGQSAIRDLIIGTSVIQSLQEVFPNTTALPNSRLHVQAMSAKLARAPASRSLLLSLRKAPSNIALRAIQTIIAIPHLPEPVKHDMRVILRKVKELVGTQEDAGKPLRSEDDVKNSTLRTTVVAQKVELSKQTSALSKQDAAYTTLIRRFSDLLDSYLTKCLIDPKGLVMNEVFVYDLTSPYREVFTPRTRGAIERALATPHDYLDCDCCKPEQADGDEATLAASQPATAVLYQLYLESGSLINVSDLWQAFQAVYGDDAGEGGQETMALFQRALANLRYLGLVKSTRKRADHIAKVAWKGL